jgi:hypothetical protein
VEELFKNVSVDVNAMLGMNVDVDWNEELFGSI